MKDIFFVDSYGNNKKIKLIKTIEWKKRSNYNILISFCLLFIIAFYKIKIKSKTLVMTHERIFRDKNK